MLILEFLCLILLYATRKAITSLNNDDNLGDMLFILLVGFGVLFLVLDAIEKVIGWF
jgi:hypothetical protein